MLWIEQALPLAGVVFVISITPGPNNVLVMASGRQFGVLRTVPHLLGIAAGFALLLLLVWAGVDSLLRSIPGIQGLISVICAGWILWMAVQLVKSPPPGEGPMDHGVGLRRPWRFPQALAFQFVNPKCWAVAATCAGIASELPADAAGQALLLALVSTLVNLPCVGLWAAAGSAAGRWLVTPRLHRGFNVVMALLLLLTVVWMVEELV